MAVGVPGHVHRRVGDVAGHQVAVWAGHLASKRQGVPDEARPLPAALAAGDTPSTGKYIQRLQLYVTFGIYSYFNARNFK